MTTPDKPSKTPIRPMPPTQRLDPEAPPRSRPVTAKTAPLPAGSTPAVGARPQPSSTPKVAADSPIPRGSTPKATSTATPTSTPRPKSSPRPQPPSQVSSMQIVFGSILAISLLLAINFSGRIAAGQRIQAELGVLQATVSAERARATALKRDYDYVVSDAFVERWARSLEGMMVKPGEVLVLPLPGRATPVPPPTPAAPTVDSSFDDGPQNWALWWQLFFDVPPPGVSN